MTDTLAGNASFGTAIQGQVHLASSLIPDPFFSPAALKQIQDLTPFHQDHLT